MCTWNLAHAKWNLLPPGSFMGSGYGLVRLRCGVHVAVRFSYSISQVAGIVQRSAWPIVPVQLEMEKAFSE
jgi:hypothetical protein